LSSSVGMRIHPFVAPEKDVTRQVSACSPEASLQNPEDAVLMARLQKGDLQALEVLYDRYCGVILGVGSRLLRDAAEAEDLVQEVFLYLFRKSHVYSISKSSVASWLIQVAYARAFDRRKWLRRRGRELQQSYEGTILAEPAAPGPNPEELAELSALRSYFMLVFESLTKRQRETIQLYFFEGYSLLEISQKVGDSFPSIRGLYARALERLRNRLSEDGFPIRRER